MTDQGGRRHFRSLDWDAIVGISAAAIALALHLLHVVEEDVVLSIILVLLALLLLRDLRREDADERLGEASQRSQHLLEAMERRLVPADADLVGPRRLRDASAAFSRNARGEMTWFNVCLLMFRPQSLFDVLLGSALSNPRVTAIQFVLDRGEQENWRTFVLPKVAPEYIGTKLREPYWCDLQEAVSFILADNDAGTTEAQLSFWGEPFMSRTSGQDIPRYIFHVHAHSELVAHLAELERTYRASGRA